MSSHEREPQRPPPLPRRPDRLTLIKDKPVRPERGEANDDPELTWEDDNIETTPIPIRREGGDIYVTTEEGEKLLRDPKARGLEVSIDQEGRKVVRENGRIIKHPALELLLNGQPLERHTGDEMVPGAEAFEEAVEDAGEIVNEWERHVAEMKIKLDQTTLDADLRQMMRPVRPDGKVYPETAAEMRERANARRERLEVGCLRLNRWIHHAKIGLAQAHSEQAPEKGFLWALREMCEESRASWGRAGDRFLKNPNDDDLAELYREEMERLSRLEGFYSYMKRRYDEAQPEGGVAAQKSRRQRE